MASSPAAAPIDPPWPPDPAALPSWSLPARPAPVTTALPGEPGTLAAADGLTLATRRWPAAQPRALLALVHGFGEHAGRYAMLATQLAAADIEVWAHDLRGHGGSAGPRGHIGAYDTYLDDLSTLIGAMKAARSSTLPVFVFGHSMGGGIALNYAIRRGEGLRGVIASGPYLRLAFEPPAWKSAIAGWLAGFWPSASFDAGIDAALLSHDTAQVQAYRDDPKVHGRITARAFVEVGAAGEDAIDRAGELRMPMLLLHGGADAITDADTSAAFVLAAGADDRTFIRFPGLYHEILNEPEGPLVRAAIVDWLLERV